MKKLFAKTRIKNIGNNPMMLRWLTKAGMYLNPGQEVVVDGFYPSEVAKTNMLPSCVYDIESGRIEIELITNLATRQPTEDELSAVPSRPTPASQEVPAVAVQTQLPTPSTAKEERWGIGGIEDMKPKAKVLPGHEETLAMLDKGPATLDIFPNGPTVEPPTTAPRTSQNVAPVQQLEATVADTGRKARRQAQA